MYKGKSLLIGNTELATFKDIKNFLFHNTSSLNTDSKSIDLYLRKSSYIMEHSYLNEHLLFQTGAAMYPPIKSREQLLPLYRYGPSNGQYSHCYSITDIIQTELLLLELDFLHSLKYCMLYWTAIPSVGNLILESSYNKINVNKSHKYPIDHNYFINNIKDMPEDGMLFTKKCMASSSDADVNSNSSLRRNLSEFFKNNETVLQYLGLHKTATSYRLPFTELYSFYSLFAFKRNLLSTSDIAEYNMQIVEDLKKQKYKRRKPEWFLYSYRINHLFLIQTKYKFLIIFLYFLKCS